MADVDGLPISHVLRGQSRLAFTAEMSTPTRRTYNLLQHLRVLFKFLNFFGLTGVSFSPRTQKFEQSNCRQKVTTYVYKAIKYLSGIFLLNMVFRCFTDSITLSSFVGLRSVEAQEETISAFSGNIHTTSALIYALNYFRMQDGLLRLFNEVLGMFNKLKERTEPQILLSSRIVWILFVKGVILAFIMKYVIVISLLMLFMNLFINIDFTFFPILSALMFFSYFYIQLIMVGFYEKMNEYLVTFGDSMDQGVMEKYVREFMSISRRIHTFKRRLDGFGSSVFMCTYMGLFHDIEFLYLTLKIVFYSKYFSDYNHYWFQLNFHYFPACLAFIFDMFIIGLLSDMLEDANGKFQALVVKLTECAPALQRDVDVMLMGDKICGLGLRAFGQIKVNQQFSFDFMLNTVMVFVIMFLQFFAAEQIYTMHFKKVTITREYVINL